MVSPEYFAEFLEATGHRVVKTRSAYWYNPSFLAFNSFPFHRLIVPDEEEFIQMWRFAPALVLRYPTPCESIGHPSYRFACQTKGYQLEHLSSKARNQTRKGLKECLVHQIDFSLLEREGLKLHISTLQRQKRELSRNMQESWHRLCFAASTNPSCEAWGAFVNNQLAAFVIGIIVEDCYNFSIVRSSQVLLKHYPNNALIYEVTKSALARPDISDVSYGLESLQEELDGLVHFKISMGFKKIPIRQRTVFQPLIAPIVFSGTRSISQIASKYPNNHFMRKLKGVMKFAAISD